MSNVPVSTWDLSPTFFTQVTNTELSPHKDRVPRQSTTIVIANIGRSKPMALNSYINLHLTFNAVGLIAALSALVIAISFGKIWAIVPSIAFSLGFLDMLITVLVDKVTSR